MLLFWSPTELGMHVLCPVEKERHVKVNRIAVAYYRIGILKNRPITLEVRWMFFCPTCGERSSLPCWHYFNYKLDMFVLRLNRESDAV